MELTADEIMKFIEDKLYGLRQTYTIWADAVNRMPLRTEVGLSVGEIECNRVAREIETIKWLLDEIYKEDSKKQRENKN